VLIFTDTGVLPGVRPPEPNEVARHKLLDLVGDLALFGGPPRGRIVAERPGHAATQEIAREALARGILARR
jgi:UDP-3-O-acyl-N-acetylglucosamine deacetylase